MEQSALSLVQLRSSIPPPDPRHDQVDDHHPHDPAILALVIPAEQAKFVELSQEPLMVQAGLDLVQLVSFEPPPDPRQVQVDDPPHDPATFAVSVPVVQPN